jgi:hypothetical protein
MAVATLLAFATSLYKDYGDEAGDAAAGKMTPLVTHGSGYVARLALMVQGAALVLGILWLGVAWWSLPAVAALCITRWIDSPRRHGVVVGHRYLTTASICMLAAGSLG